LNLVLDLTRSARTLGERRTRRERYRRDEEHTDETRFGVHDGAGIVTAYGP